MKLVVNLPAFNEQEKIGQTIKRIPRAIKGVDEVFVQVIDDGSHDDTAKIAKQAGADFVFSHDINRGIGVTFRTAVTKALENGADIMVNMDADGQFDPKDIEKIIAPIISGEADMVSADRFGDKRATNMPKSKYYLNMLAALIIRKFMNYPIRDLTCGFRGYSKETLLRLNLPGEFTYTQETIIDAIGKNLKLKWIPVEVTYFEGRKSRVVKSICNYVNNSSRIILKAVRDVRPMRFFGIPSLVILIFSAVFFVIFAYLYLQDLKITPYRNYLFAAITLFVVGIQFLIFALIADMIKTSRRLTEDLMYHVKVDRYKK